MYVFFFFKFLLHSKNNFIYLRNFNIKLIWILLFIHFLIVQHYYWFYLVSSLIQLWLLKSMQWIFNFTELSSWKVFDFIAEIPKLLVRILVPPTVWWQTCTTFTPFLPISNTGQCHCITPKKILITLNRILAHTHTHTLVLQTLRSTTCWAREKFRGLSIIYIYTPYI